MPKRRLFLDIETAPNVGVFWQSGNEVNVGYENILQERTMITACWKWEGDKSVSAISWLEPWDDSNIAARVSELIEEADEVVAHNGDRFDIPWVRTRCIKHGHPMPPKIVTHDTCALSRRLFKYNSNRLDYIGKYLGVGNKIDTGGLSLWLKVIKGDKAALREMERYCKQDVNLLQRVFHKMLPYIPAKTHLTGKVGDCPECGSGNRRISKHRITASGQKTVQLVCADCGKYQTVAASKIKQ